MTISRNLWTSSLTENHAPKWPCATCHQGHTALVPGTLHYGETAETQRARHSIDMPHITDLTYSFGAMLECSHCHGLVSCCGIGGHEPTTYFDEEEGYTTNYYLEFYPRYFSVPMAILRPPSRTPKLVVEQLNLSFSVFFSDLGAAANRVRQSIEEILSEFGIEATNADGKFIQLNDRIEQFSDSGAENVQRAHALRLIGNFGSHPQGLSRKHLFDAYDIVEVLLEDLYVGHQRSVQETVEKIVKSNGPKH